MIAQTAAPARKPSGGSEAQWKAAGHAAAVAKRLYVKVLGAYAVHPDPMKRQHPLRWTIDRAWNAAAKRAARQPWPVQEAVWRETAAKMAEFAALISDKPKLAEMVAEQEREMEQPTPVAPPASAPDVVGELLDRLGKRGIKLVAQGGKIIAQPRAFLAATDMDELASHKTAIIARLTANQVSI